MTATGPNGSLASLCRASVKSVKSCVARSHEIFASHTCGQVQKREVLVCAHHLATFFRHSIEL